MPELDEPTILKELRQRNADLSQMAAKRDFLQKALENIADYDDGTKSVVNGECGEMALRALEEVKNV